MIEYYEFRVDAPPLHVNHLCFLLPAFFSKEVYQFKTTLPFDSKVQFQTYEPTYPRKHLTMIISGVWDDLIRTKVKACEFFDDRIAKLNQPSCKNFIEFQRFAFHKQLRFCLKILRRVKLENENRYLTYWDTTSVIIAEAGLQEIMPASHLSIIEFDS